MMTDVRFETFGLDSGLLSPAKPMGHLHHHHELELNFLFRGRVTYLHRNGVHELQPGRLAVFWGSTPHNLISAEPDSEMAWITVPLSWLWMWKLPENFTKMLMEGRWWLAPTSGAMERFPIRAWIQEMPEATPLRQRALSLELEACFLWMAEHSSLPRGNSRPTSNGNHLGHIEAMARCMAERFREEVDIAEIAASASLHPNYAMPLFRRHCGVTLRDYLTQLRLTHAQRLLLTTDHKVIDVALASGFRSVSSFYEAFLRVVKVTPRAFRTRMQR
jgi:AraC-like DNA-binding protein